MFLLCRDTTVPFGDLPVCLVVAVSTVLQARKNHQRNRYDGFGPIGQAEKRNPNSDGGC